MQKGMTKKKFYKLADQMVMEHNAGFTYREIARKHHRATSTAYSIIHNHINRKLNDKTLPIRGVLDKKGVHYENYTHSPELTNSENYH